MLDFWRRRRVQRLQRKLCERLGAQFTPLNLQLNVGLSQAAREGAWPLKGVRHLPVGGTTGWYIYAGEWSKADDFYKPVCAQHIEQACPLVLPYLALPPGWGFVLAPDYEDVWFDEKLLIR